MPPPALAALRRDPPGLAQGLVRDADHMRIDLCRATASSAYAQHPMLRHRQPWTAPFTGHRPPASTAAHAVQVPIPLSFRFTPG